jgi:sulfur carrier protein ThiS adenylyltransferase
MYESEKIPDIFVRNPPHSYSILKKATVGIAGCGGLGSNAAVMLTRAGIGHLIVVDFDIVAPENLNRQHFFIDQIGKPKVEALGEIIKKINPDIDYVPYQVNLIPENIPHVFRNVDVLIEAFDDAEQKSMLINTWTNLCNGKLLIAASGLAGYGKCEKIKISRMGDLIVVGDLCSPLTEGLIAPRVMMVSAIEANLVIEYLLEKKK